MLVARGKIEVGAAAFSSTLVLERRFRIYVEEREDTIWDSRFVRPRTAVGGGRPVVFVLLDGWHDFHAHPSGAMTGPAVFVASQDVVDGLRGPEYERSSGGTPCRTIQLRFMDGPDLLDEKPRRIDDADAIIDAARAIVATDGDDLGGLVATFLEACADADVAPRGLASTITAIESRNLTRIWKALNAPHLLVARFPALDRVADLAGLSTRHAARAVEEVFSAFNLEWSGWRDVINEIRLRCAVMLLSSPSVSINEVAGAAGYGSVTALGGALRKAGLPGPRELRSLILQREEERIARSRRTD